MDMMVQGLRPALAADCASVLRGVRRPAAFPPGDDLLGQLCYGDAGADALRMPLLSGAARADGWHSAGPQRNGQTGLLRWRHTENWLYGTLAFEPAEGALAAGVQQAYLDLFDGLRRTGFTHALRLWNYIPHINAPEQGLERYRHFNLGRQQAFLQAGQSAFEGSPAACALGPHDGPVMIRVLAARQAPLPLENPRQVSAYHYPSQYGPRAPSFSRAALADAGGGELLLLISGTASIVGHATVHGGDVVRQLHETLANLEALIEAARQRCNAHFALCDLVPTVYIRHAEHAETVRALLAEALGADASAVRDAVLLQADICREDLLVEIEAHAQAPGEVTG